MVSAEVSSGMCEACGKSGDGVALLVPEMMYGSRREYRYASCPHCSMLKLLDEPPPRSEEYPENYYSTNSTPNRGILYEFLQTAWLRNAGRAPDIAARLLARLRGLPDIAVWASLAGWQTTESILDVGCGFGQNLRRLRRAGYRQLTGVDPLLPHTEMDIDGVRLFKGLLDEVEGIFDHISFHHSLEHMDSTVAVLRSARERTRCGGTVLVRSPVAGCWAQTRFGRHWVQLDAPRHRNIHSVRGLSACAENAGLRCRAVRFDSGAFQFWGSIQYEKGIPLLSPRSYAVNPANSIFTRRDIRRFEREARRLNDRGEGDQAVVVFEVL